MRSRLISLSAVSNGLEFEGAAFGGREVLAVDLRGRGGNHHRK